VNNLPAQSNYHGSIVPKDRLDTIRRDFRNVAGVERRNSTRKTAATKVYLHHPSLPPRPCTTRNISATGAFVQTPDAARLRRGTQLELTFVVDVGNVTKLHQFNGVVTQVAPDGVGLSISKT